jgi:hypothetical protein
MVRSRLIALLVLSVCAADPAAAQFPSIFDSIFGNPPPRPPADVPSQPRSEPQYIPPPGQRGQPPGPPPGVQGGLPPGPPPGRIQMQPLPPPPGATSAPPAARVAPANVNPQATPPVAAPGSPPGQRQPRPAQPSEETVVEPPAHKVPNPTAVFAGLDKITGRIISFDVAINETVRFGALEVTPRACYTRPPTETPNTDGFIEVDELTLQGELRRIFTGWMFAASPGLSAVEHPIYDIWLTDCKGAKEPVVAETPPAAAPPRAPQRAQQPGQPPQRRATQQLPPPPQQTLPR